MNILLENMTLLTEYNLVLTMEIPSIPSNEIETLQIGDEIVFKLTDNEGYEFYSSSIYDPVYEAEQFLANVNYDNTGYIVLGLNSSAVLKRILSRKTETAWVLVIEKDPRVIRRFLEEVNLSPYLEGKLQRLVFLYGDRTKLEERFDQFLHTIIGYYFLQAEVVRTYPTYRVHQEEYQWIFETILDKIKKNMINLGNSLEDSRIGIKNELKNLKHALRSRKLKQLENQFEGVPMVCVASGPSLDKQLPLLKELQGRAIIISAESAFRVLLKHGIVPDALCILERGEASYDLSLKGLDIPDQTVLFGLTLIDPRIYDNWPGRKVPIFKTNVSHCKLLNDALGDFGTMYSGNSVAHMNFSLANYLGSKRIILIGQDLAYAEDGKTHSKDTFYDNEEVEKLDDKYKKIIKDSLEDATTLFNKEVFIDGYYGGKVRSRELWRNFLMWFTHLLEFNRKEDSLFINATEGGADIPGTVKMPFREAIETYCQDPVVSIAEKVDQLSVESVDIKDTLQLLCDYIYKTTNRIVQIAKTAELNLKYMDNFGSDVEENRSKGLYEMKLARILKLTESILKDVIFDPFGIFYFSPLISNYHVKTNPISRINPNERIESILRNQKYLLEQIIEGKDLLEKLLMDGFHNVIEELDYTIDDFTMPEDETELLKDDERETEHE